MRFWLFHGLAVLYIFSVVVWWLPALRLFCAAVSALCPVFDGVLFFLHFCVNWCFLCCFPTFVWFFNSCLIFCHWVLFIAFYLFNISALIGVFCIDCWVLRVFFNISALIVAFRVIFRHLCGFQRFFCVVSIFMLLFFALFGDICVFFFRQFFFIVDVRFYIFSVVECCFLAIFVFTFPHYKSKFLGLTVCFKVICLSLPLFAHFLCF